MVPTPPFAVQGHRRRIAHELVPLRDRQPSRHGAALLAWTVFGSQVVRALEDPAGISLSVIAAALLLLVALTYAVPRWFAKQETRIRRSD